MIEWYDSYHIIFLSRSENNFFFLENPSSKHSEHTGGAERWWEVGTRKSPLRYHSILYLSQFLHDAIARGHVETGGHVLPWEREMKMLI